MPRELCIVIIIFMIVFFCYVMKNVAHHKLSVKNSLIWAVLVIGVIICLFQIDNLEKLAKLIGIETVSNMLFFLGFVFLIFICFNFTKHISLSNKKIINLTQEIALLRKEIQDDRKK